MKIVVPVKVVPDTYATRRLDLSTHRVDRSAADLVVDEISERGLEAALRHLDSDRATEVVVLTMGPSSTTDSLRKCLAMGATSAVQVTDASLVGADLPLTAAVLAAALRKVGFDLVITGNESTDGRGGVIPTMVAEHLGIAHATALDALDITATTVSGERSVEGEVLAVSAELPAVASITERMPEARFPSFRGTMTAKKKPLTIVSLQDLGLSVDGRPRSTVLSVVERPPRTGGQKVSDSPAAVAQLVAFLATRGLG